MFSDFIVCLEDGKKLKILTRHLRTNYNMSPDDCRAKWGLPSDYPMVGPSYASHRSTLAKQIGLGRKPVVEGIASVVMQTTLGVNTAGTLRKGGQLMSANLCKNAAYPC